MSLSSVRTNMEKTLQAVIQGFNDIDYDQLRATRTDDFIYQFLPLSLGAPARNNDEYKEFFDNLFKATFKEFKVVPKSFIFDVDAKRATMHAHAETLTVIGPYTIEIVMMLTFNDTGDKVKRIDEMFDSAVYSGFFVKLQAHLAQAGQQAAA